MKKLELSDEAIAALQQVATDRHLSPSDLVMALLAGSRPTRAGDQLLAFLAGDAFSARTDSTDRYLELLAWCAKNHAADFADFISHQDSGRRYLMLDRDGINAVRSGNHARQIDGTQFWAVMTIDDATRRRFICRLLEFIGYPDETVATAIRALSLAATDASASRLLSA